MPKGSWREFEDTAVKQTLQSSFQIESKSQLPVRVQKTRVGKGGKTVTVISGLTTRDNDQAKKTFKTFEISLWNWRNYQRRLVRITR